MRVPGWHAAEPPRTPLWSLTPAPMACLLYAGSTTEGEEPVDDSPNVMALSGSAITGSGSQCVFERPKKALVCQVS